MNQIYIYMETLENSLLSFEPFLKTNHENKYLVVNGVINISSMYIHLIKRKDKYVTVTKKDWTLVDGGSRQVLGVTSRRRLV